MRNLIALIIKYHFTILFIIIESVALFLVVQFNDYPRSSFYSYTQGFIGSVNEKAFSIDQYLSLRDINQKLMIENRKLRNELEQYKRLHDTIITKQPHDTTASYYFLEARIVNNSVNKQYNYITINRGYNDGIREDMAVLSRDGVVGVVNNVSPNYATVITLLNRRMKISGKIKKNKYFGSVHWQGKDYRFITLSEIPYHVKIDKGDKVITSGYSHIFPEGIEIGTIMDFDLSEGNFYNIRLRLATDFKNISHVYVIRHNEREEIVELESKSN